MTGSTKSKLLATIALALLWGTAFAPDADAGKGSIDVERFRPQVDGFGLFGLESPNLHEQWGFSAGVMVHYARDQFIVVGSGGKRAPLVEDRSTANLLASFSPLKWLELGGAFPIALWNDANANALGSGSGVTGFGSMRLQLKLRFVEERAHGFGLGLIAAAELPTGNHNAFLGQNFVVFSPALLFEKTIGPMRIIANIGYTARERTRFRSFVVDDELFFGLGLGVRVHRRVEIGAELFGATPASSPFGSDAFLNPLELLLGAKITLGSWWHVYGGAGPGLTQGYGTPSVRLFAGLMLSQHTRDTDKDGLYDPDDRCPLAAGPKENGGCPWPDTDGDGVLDKDDKCPSVSGPTENGGCPWPDSDGDGILDKDDRCPLTPGPVENSGCPWRDADRDGILDKDDKCPSVPGPKENKGCPWPDSDNDGILDKDDKCPRVWGPKANEGCPWPDTDKDGLLDKDDDCPKSAGPVENKGCPWPDADKDGVFDKDDDCPTDPGPADNRGCPRAAVQVRRGEIRILEQVFFRSASHMILAKSYNLLDQVVEALKKHTELKLIEVQGHTDDLGPKKYNIKLSDRRARSVREYLIGNGIAEERIVSKGYGPTLPVVKIDKKKMKKKELKAARAQNRRVQFVIVKKAKQIQF